MKIVKCGACKKEYEDGARFCPHCGESSGTCHEGTLSNYDITIEGSIGAVGSLGELNLPAPIAPLSAALEVATFALTALEVVLDKTASMTAINNLVASHLGKMTDEMVRSEIDCRLGLIIARDIKYHGPEGLIDCGWLELDSFKQMVQREKCLGNDTHDESQADGIAVAAMRLGKLQIDSRCKFILMVTNSGCHDPLEDGTTVTELAAALRQSGITVYIVGPTNCKNYRLICQETGGTLFDVKSLNLEHFLHVLLAIGKTIKGSIEGSVGGY